MKPILTNGINYVYEDKGRLFYKGKDIGPADGYKIAELNNMYGFMGIEGYESWDVGDDD